jgi:hypothetical protein
MTLNNFGSLLGFSLEIETQNAVFFADAATAPQCEPARPLFEGLAKNSRKRIKEIERTRRENVTEMILENLEGFTKAPFMRDPGDPKALAKDEVIATAEELLKRSIRFYAEAGPKLKRLPEVAGALKRLAKKSKRDAEQIAGLQG